MRARWWMALAIAGCQPLTDEDIDLGVVLHEPTLQQLVDGVPLGIDVSIDPSSTWDLFGVRSRGCRANDAIPIEPVPWTTGTSSEVRLACSPAEGTSSCGTRAADPFCCARASIPDAEWCEIDLVTDEWGVEDDEVPPGIAVVVVTVNATGGSLDAWLDIPHLTLRSDSTLRSTSEVVQRRNGVRRVVEVPNSLVAELGDDGWLAPVAGSLGQGEQVVVRPGDPLHDQLVNQLINGSSLHVDVDNDGFVDDEERSSLGAFSLAE